MFAKEHEDLAEELRKIIAEITKAKVSKITESSSLTDGLEVDSLMAARYVIHSI